EGKDGHLGAAYFHATNRGKRSIECDFETEDGKRIVRKLAAKSDILIENFKVGGLAKFGLDYKSLAPSCPRLIYCSVTGFGLDGRRAGQSGDELSRLRRSAEAHRQCASEHRALSGVSGCRRPHHHRNRQ